MRIIANENITGSVINKLRATGHDVLSVKETMRGANDPDVLSRAQTEQRLNRLWRSASAEALW